MNLSRLAIKAYVAAQIALALPWLIFLILVFPLSITLLPVLPIAIALLALPLAFVLCVFYRIAHSDVTRFNAKGATLGGALFGLIIGILMGIINFHLFYAKMNTIPAAMGGILLLSLIFAYIGGVAICSITVLLRNENHNPNK